MNLNGVSQNKLLTRKLDLHTKLCASCHYDTAACTAGCMHNFFHRKRCCTSSHICQHVLLDKELVITKGAFVRRWFFVNLFWVEVGMFILLCSSGSTDPPCFLVRIQTSRVNPHLQSCFHHCVIAYIYPSMWFIWSSRAVRETVNRLEYRLGYLAFG